MLIACGDLCKVALSVCVCVDCYATSSHDKTGFNLRGVQIYLSVKYPARVRIWVISAFAAPNKHKSCKSCSSRTKPSVTATMIVSSYVPLHCAAIHIWSDHRILSVCVVCVWLVKLMLRSGNSRIKLTCLATV